MWKEEEFQGEGITSIERKKVSVPLRLPLYQLIYICMRIASSFPMSILHPSDIWLTAHINANKIVHPYSQKLPVVLGADDRTGGGKKVNLFFRQLPGVIAPVSVCLHGKLRNYSSASTVTGKKKSKFLLMRKYSAGHSYCGLTVKKKKKKKKLKSQYINKNVTLLILRLVIYHWKHW